MTSEIEAALPLEPPRAGCELRNRQAASLVHVERNILQFDRVILDLFEITFTNAAAADLV